VNGALAAETTVLTIFPNPALDECRFNVGTFPNGDACDGQNLSDTDPSINALLVDDVRVFARALDDIEIQLLFGE
jgi:hypothetical protein